MNTTLLVIDPQIDFCDVEGAALPVPGADADMRRLSQLVERASGRLNDIIVTLDTHATVSIERTTFWKQGDGSPVGLHRRSRSKRYALASTHPVTHPGCRRFWRIFTP